MNGNFVKRDVEFIQQKAGKLFFSGSNENFMAPAFHFSNEIFKKIHISGMAYAKKDFQFLSPLIT